MCLFICGADISLRQDIGGTPILFTLIVAVNCLSEVVMFFMATYFVQKIGHDAVIYTGLGCYGLRFLLYSYLQEPWWVLPLEALQGFTYGGVWTASVAYVGPQPGETPSRFFSSWMHCLFNCKICLPQESDFAELRSNVISIPATIPKRLLSTVSQAKIKSDLSNR